MNVNNHLKHMTIWPMALNGFDSSARYMGPGHIFDRFINAASAFLLVISPSTPHFRWLQRPKNTRWMVEMFSGNTINPT